MATSSHRLTTPQAFRAYSLIWAALIFVLSAQPTLPAGGFWWGDFVFKKLAHIFVYMVLCYLLLKSQSKPSIKGTVYAVLITIFYAISDEIHQSMVPGRNASIFDVGFDTLGASIAVLRFHGQI